MDVVKEAVALSKELQGFRLGSISGLGSAATQLAR